MWLVVFVLCIPLILAGAIPGQEKCAWGEPYWCSHISHARECGATQHCLQTVWKRQMIKPQSTKTCTYCQLLVNEFRDALRDKATEEKVATVLANVCAVLPSTDTRDMCKDIVTEYAPEVIQMLVNDISTDMVCATLHLCSGLEDNVSPYGEKASNTSDCDDCMRFFHDVQASITSNETVNQLRQILNQTLCSRLGSLQQICMEMVDQYLPVFLQMLADQIDPDITCRVFGFCSSQGKVKADVVHIKNIFQNRKSVGELKYRSSEECEICKDLLNQIVETIRDKTIQDHITSDLKNVVCKALGGFANQCKEFVDEYAPMLFEFLANELDPTTFCETVGLCTVPSATDVVKALKVEPAGMVGSGYIKEPVECTLCKYFMEQLDDLLKNNDTIKTIEDFIDKICVRLPTEDLTAQCKAFVQEYGQMVIDLLAQELDPKMICKAIGLCQGSLKVPKGVSKLGDGDLCPLCVLLIGQLEQAVANISTEELLADLKMVCSIVPATLTDSCNKYVNQFGPIIISLLKSKEDPKSLCQLASLCPGTKTPYMTKPIPEDLSTGKFKVPSEECKICNTVVVMAKSFLQNNASKEEIKQALESVCKLLPSALESTCEGFIETYGDRLIDLLMKELNASAICTELGLCQASKKPIPASAVSVVMSPYDTLPIVSRVENKKGSAPSIECEVCDTIILYLKSFLADNASRAEIEAALETLCDEVPAAFQDTCKTLVDTYGNQIIDLLLQKLDAHAVCTGLGLCQASDNKVLKMTEVMSPYDILPILQPEGKQKGATTKPIVVGSTTYKRSCEFGLIQCSLNEMCAVVSEKSRNGICVCDTDSTFDSKTGLCQPVQRSAPSIECEVCDTIILYLKSFLADNASRAEIEAALETLCDEVPAVFQDTCKTLVDTYGDQIIDLLLQKLDAHAVCTGLGLCQASDNKVLKMTEVMSPYDTLPILQPEVKQKESIKAGGEPECEACKIIMNFLDKELQDNRTDESIKAALKEVCDALPESVRSQCHNLVDTYAQILIDYLLLSMSPDEICQKLSFCPAGIRKLPEPVHVKLLKDDSGLKSKVGAGPACVLCEFIMRELDRILAGNKTQAAVTAALGQVCSFFPDTIRPECEDFINTYSKLIVHLLVETLADPSTVCSDIRLCTAELDKEVKVEASPGCVICEFVMKVVDEILMGNKSEAAVVSALDKVCDFFPDTIRSECVGFVNTYSGVIINLIVKTLADPDTVCTKIGLCKTNIVKPITSQIDNKTGKLDASPICVLCEFILKELDSLLGDNRSEEAIKKALNTVCGEFPDTIRAECIVFVNKYSDLIIKLLVNEIDPQQICTALGLCTGQSVASWGTFVKLLPQKSKVGLDACPICLFVVEQLQEFLKQNRTEQEIELFLKNLCDKLPDTVTVQCHDVIDEYIPAILDLIDENLKPDAICKQVGLCNATNAVTEKKDDHTLHFKSQKLVGQNKCTFGPSYWCASKDNALECNAMEHCMRHVWN